MKTLIIGLAAAFFALTGHAGTITLATGTAKEKINNTLEVNLYQIGVSYRFDNGLLAGTSLQKGYPKLSGVADETRTEVMTGYATKFQNFLPYATVSRGWRSRNGRPDVDYYAVQIGTRYLFNDAFYGNVSFRYRDSHDIPWRTETYFVGGGYLITANMAVQLQYGKTHGDFESDQYGIFLINRF